MAFDDSVIGGGSSFDPRAATESLIRQVDNLPPGGPVDARMLATRLARKLGQDPPPPEEPVPTPRPRPTRSAPTPPAEGGALDFSAQAIPPSPTDGTSTGLDFSAQASEPVPLPVPRPADAPQAPATSLSDYPVEFGKGVLEGGKNMGASALKGVAGAGIPSVADPAFLDELARAPGMTAKERAGLMSRVMTTVSDRGLQIDFNAALRRVAQGGDPAVEIAQLRPKFGINNEAATTPVTEKPLYKAGQAIEEFGKEALAPRPGFEPGKSWTRDIGAGAGSMVAGIGMSMVPGIGPAAAGALFTTSGMGEAVDNAVKGGATPQQTRQSALLGGVAGATDMVDTLLPMLGSTGKAVGFIKRMGVAAVKGAMIEGGQEGVQQLMQNAIAKGIYKPDQDMFEDVPRSMAIAAILGGVAGGASGIAHGDHVPAPPAAAAPGGPSSGGPAPGGPASEPGGGPSSPEDIADFVKKAKESAPPPPEPGPAPAPDPATMSDAERMAGFHDARQAFGGAGMDEILRAYGWDESSVAQMGEQDKINEVIKAGREKAAGTGKFAGDATSNAQAEPEAQPQAQPKQAEEPEPAGHRDYAVLREYGYSDEDIANMSPRQRARDVKDAEAGGIVADEAMQKHQPPAAAAPASEPDVAPGTRLAPIKAASAEDVLKAKPADPTPAQAAAENYQHAHLELAHLGLSGKNSISIETGVGQERSGTGADGKPWTVRLDHAAYGRIKGTRGADGQPLDIFVGPHPSSPHVFVVDQHHPGAGFDEHKIMARLSHADRRAARLRQFLQRPGEGSHRPRHGDDAGSVQGLAANRHHQGTETARFGTRKGRGGRSSVC
jgi:hypothetical protein